MSLIIRAQTAEAAMGRERIPTCFCKQPLLGRACSPCNGMYLPCSFNLGITHIVHEMRTTLGIVDAHAIGLGTFGHHLEEMFGWLLKVSDCLSEEWPVFRGGRENGQDRERYVKVACSKDAVICHYMQALYRIWKSPEVRRACSQNRVLQAQVATDNDRRDIRGVFICDSTLKTSTCSCTLSSLLLHGDWRRLTICAAPLAHSTFRNQPPRNHSLLQHHHHVLSLILSETVRRSRPFSSRILDYSTIPARSPNAGWSTGRGPRAGRDWQGPSGQIRCWNKSWSKRQQTDIVVPCGQLRSRGSSKRLCARPQ